MTDKQVSSISPSLTKIVQAKEAISGMKGKLGHSGPPLFIENLLPLQKNAILSVLCYEGIIDQPKVEMVKEKEKEEELVAEILTEHAIQIQPNYDFHVVAPLVGIVSESMPLLVVEDIKSGRTVFTPINEGTGESIRGGNVSINVVNRLKWMEQTLAPILSECIDVLGDIDLLPIIQEALRMGDELHMRNSAASMLFSKELHSVLFYLPYNLEDLREVSTFLNQNPFLFLNLSMAVSQLYLQSFEGTKGEPVVTACSANGREIGIQISTKPGKWFTVPAVVPMHQNHIEDPLAPVIGDSLIIEAFGMGGRLTTLAPSLWEAIGVTNYQEVYQQEKGITGIAVTKLFTCSFNHLHNQGLSVGIDVKKAAINEQSIVANTALLHLNGGIKGIGRAPIPPTCFKDAYQFYESRSKGSALT